MIGETIQPLARHALDVSLLDETRQRFTDRRAAAAVDARENGFRQRFAGNVGSVNDAPLDLLIDALDTQRFVVGPVRHHRGGRRAPHRSALSLRVAILAHSNARNSGRSGASSRRQPSRDRSNAASRDELRPSHTVAGRELRDTGIEMSRLRAALGGGPRLLVKRDDLIPFGCGGNKVRKMEMVAARAVDGRRRHTDQHWRRPVESRPRRCRDRGTPWDELCDRRQRIAPQPGGPTGNARLMDTSAPGRVRRHAEPSARGRMAELADELTTHGTTAVSSFRSARRLASARSASSEAAGRVAGADGSAGRHRRCQLVGRHAGRACRRMRRLRHGHTRHGHQRGRCRGRHRAEWSRSAARRDR